MKFQLLLLGIKVTTGNMNHSLCINVSGDSSVMPLPQTERYEGNVHVAEEE